MRNGVIRGFNIGISLTGSAATSSGHIIENVTVDQARFRGISVSGNAVRIQNNTVVNTGPNDAATDANGIVVENGSGNLVSGFSDTTDFPIGISLFGGDNAVMFDNTIINPFGTTIDGGGVNSDNTICVGNRVSGSTSFSTICDVDTGNFDF